MLCGGNLGEEARRVCVCAALTWWVRVDVACSPPNLGELYAVLRSSTCGCLEPCSGTKPSSRTSVARVCVVLPSNDAPGQVCVLAKWQGGPCPSAQHSTELQLCMESEPFTEIEATDGSWRTNSGEM